MDIDITTLTILIAVGMMVLLLLGLPFAFTTGALACIFILLIWGPNSLGIPVSRMTDVMRNYVFVIGPLFILMARVLAKAGVVEDLFDAVQIWMGPIGGGLAISAVIAATVMAAMSGIIGAALVTLGIIALPSMLERGYDKYLSMGSIMAGAGLGQLIPPSMVFIFYGATAGVSVGKLFIGGVFPGLLLSGCFIAYILIRVLRNPSLAPPLPKEKRVGVTFKQKIIKTKGVILPVLLIITILGSIYGGIATPTEAAAVGAFAAFCIAAGRRKLNWALMKEVFVGTTEVTGMMMWVGFGSLALVSVYLLAGGGPFVTGLLVQSGLSPLGIVFIMQLIFILLGMVISWVGIVFLTIPIFVPIIRELGFDPVWFGVLFSMNMQMAYMSPPFGQGMFYMKGVAPKGITMGDVIHSVWPFLGIQFICLMIVLFNPQIAVWLPNTMITPGR
jgi:tripartite ATP-independent transporter DctM subunit